MMRRSAALPALAIALTLAACGKSSGGGSAACGIAALTGPLAVKDAFARGNMLNVLPDSVPASLPVRVVAGPLIDGFLKHRDSTGLAFTVEGKIPAGALPGYGVLLVDATTRPLGILLFDGRAVPGAKMLGTVTVRDSALPLLGIRINLAEFQDPKCPLFAEPGQ
jgi:hypothetical protein